MTNEEVQKMIYNAARCLNDGLITPAEFEDKMWLIVNRHVTRDNVEKCARVFYGFMELVGYYHRYNEKVRSHHRSYIAFLNTMMEAVQ